MSVLETGQADRTATMSPLDEVVSPTSVESELMVTDMLDEHETALNEHGKRKRDTDGEELTPRKLPSLTRNNNEVGFVLDGSPDHELREDRDDVSLPFSFGIPSHAEWNSKLLDAWVIGIAIARLILDGTSSVPGVT
ncbi:hypothetical protein P5V15_005137 [Pogonomyrmex californicus]